MSDLLYDPEFLPDPPGPEILFPKRKGWWRRLGAKLVDFFGADLDERIRQEARQRAVKAVRSRVERLQGPPGPPAPPPPPRGPVRLSLPHPVETCSCDTCAERRMSQRVLLGAIPKAPEPMLEPQYRMIHNWVDRE